MASHSDCLPLIPGSIEAAHAKIKPFIHRTPLLTNTTLNRIASSSDPVAATAAPRTPDRTAAAPPVPPPRPSPKLKLFFKCENYQRIGAFKARGAFHALLHLIEVMGLDKVRERGVVTHSSGNHAQALALAASTFKVPAYIVMPSISTPSKIAGTQAYTEHVIFSGSTSVEREAVVQEVIRKTGAILVPPYDHPDIMLGQGTTALELDEQFQELVGDAGRGEGEAGAETREAPRDGAPPTSVPLNASRPTHPTLNAVIVPTGGGGLLSGITTYFSERPETFVFGAEPSFQGGDDAKRGLEADPPRRVTRVSTLTIADGLRTPLGEEPWKILTGSSSKKPKWLQGMHSVDEDCIKAAMRLVYERMKVVVEPSAVVGLACLLYNDELRGWIQARQEEEAAAAAATAAAAGGHGASEVRPWNVGVIFTGGNTTMDAIAGLFGPSRTGGSPTTEYSKRSCEREEGLVGMDGKRVAENVAG